VSKSLSYGALDYLIKPVDIEELVSKIETAKLKKEADK
jgi:Response regulator receiver domain.